LFLRERILVRSDRHLTAFLALLLVLLAASSAHANRLSIDDTDFDIRWASLLFAPNSGSAVRCPVTLLGRFHSATITKTAGLLIGYINHARVGACPQGALTVLTATLPWHVRYKSFAGTLPNITSVSLDFLGAAFSFNNGLGFTCLFTSSTVEPAIGTAALAAGRVTELNASSGVVDTNDIAGGFLCDDIVAGGIELSYSGSGVVEDLAGGALNIRLI
jgi:hypothetical protein